jgi:hypothetical protein
VIVITLFHGSRGRRDSRSAAHRGRRHRLHKNGGTGQGDCGSSTASMEGTRARRVAPLRATERRAWGGAVGPCGRLKTQRSCSRAFSRDEPAPQGGPRERDAVSAMENAIADRVAKGRIGHDFMPAIHRHLAGDQQRRVLTKKLYAIKSLAALGLGRGAVVR